MKVQTVVGLDVGEKRIGVAVGDNKIRIAMTCPTIEVDGGEISAIKDIVSRYGAEVLVVGYPRNQSGEATAQSRFVEAFVRQLQGLNVEIVFQDESLTSVISENRFKDYKKKYSKGDIDAEAASIILQDYFGSLA